MNKEHGLCCYGHVDVMHKVGSFLMYMCVCVCYVCLFKIYSILFYL
jgi:hypothetical protein